VAHVIGDAARQSLCIALKETLLGYQVERRGSEVVMVPHARRSRIDAASALHHVMVRGTERGAVFRNDADRDHLLELGKLTT
jgi:hypothetical protein